MIIDKLIIHILLNIIVILILSSCNTTNDLTANIHPLLLINHFGPQIAFGHTQIILNGSVTNNILNKEDISILYSQEETPILFKGNYYDVVSVHPYYGNQSKFNTYIAIVAVDGINNVIATIGIDTMYCSAISNNGTLYVYSTLVCTNGYGVIKNCSIPWVYYTKDMTNWQSNQIISNSPGFYNTSACYDGSRYVMALDQGNDGWFNITFAQSSDGTNYSLIGSTYYNTNNGPCNSSPTIRLCFVK
jgi:hypothetical protein